MSLIDTKLVLGAQVYYPMWLGVDLVTDSPIKAIFVALLTVMAIWAVIWARYAKPR